MKINHEFRHGVGVIVGVFISHDMATEWCYHVDLWHVGAQKINHGTRFEHSKFRDLSLVYDVFPWTSPLGAAEFETSHMCHDQKCDFRIPKNGMIIDHQS